jgi:hypothetical protein
MKKERLRRRNARMHECLPGRMMSTCNPALLTPQPQL